MLADLYTLAAVAVLGDEVDVTPTGAGAPGGETIQKLLDWLAQYALWACLAALLAGAGMFAYSRSRGGHGMAVSGTMLAVGGGVGTLLVGLGPEIVNALFRIT